MVKVCLYVATKEEGRDQFHVLVFFSFILVKFLNFFLVNSSEVLRTCNLTETNFEFILYFFWEVSSERLFVKKVYF